MIYLEPLYLLYIVLDIDYGVNIIIVFWKRKSLFVIRYKSDFKIEHILNCFSFCIIINCN